MSVVKTDDLAILAGGVNYFPSAPLQSNLEKLDSILGIADNEWTATMDELLAIVSLIKVEKSDPWFGHDFSGCLEALMKSGQKYECKVIIRTDRSIKKDTGTLLSPDDRAKGKEYDDKIVLTLYRLRGEVEKGWNGKPLWVPNIKFAQGFCFFLNTK